MRISESTMRSATKHLMICCTLLAMLWAQVFGLQHHLFVCLCSDEPVETAVDHCHDSCAQQHQALAADHHQDHTCDQNEGNTQHHSRLKEDLKARSEVSLAVSPHTPVLVILFTLPDPLLSNHLSVSSSMAGKEPCDIEHSPPLSLQVHQSVVFLI